MMMSHGNSSFSHLILTALRFDSNKELNKELKNMEWGGKAYSIQNKLSYFRVKLKRIKLSSPGPKPLAPKPKNPKGALG